MKELEFLQVSKYTIFIFERRLLTLKLKGQIFSVTVFCHHLNRLRVWVGLSGYNVFLKHAKKISGKWNKLPARFFLLLPAKVGTCSCSSSNEIGASSGCSIAPPEQLPITDPDLVTYRIKKLRKRTRICRRCQNYKKKSNYC